MPCLFVILGVLMPRVVMIFMALLTDCFKVAFETTLWPILGWIFMPYTTLAYMAAMVSNDHQLTGGWLVMLIVAVFWDLSLNVKCGNHQSGDGG